MAYVRHYAEPLFPGPHHKYGTVGAVVGRRDSPDRDLAEADIASCHKQVDVCQPSQSEVPFCAAQRPGRNINGKPVFSLIYSGVADVVGMVMGDDDRVHLTYVPAAGSEPLFGLGPADA